MKKSMFGLIGLSIIFSMLCSLLIIPASAARELNSIDDVNVDEYYNRMTISFGSAPTSLALQNVEETVGSNIEEAKDYVQSLGLESGGYKYIEDACLQQLESMQNDGIILTSYSVLLPKKRASINPIYYKTIGNIDYYYAYYSSYTAEIQRQVLKDRMKEWANASSDIILEFVSEFANFSVPIQFSMLLNAAQLSPGYKIIEQSKTENYFLIASDCRGIFVNDTYHAGAYYPWTLYYSAETGTARASCIWFPLDINLPENEYAWTEPTRHNVSTKHYSDLDWNVMQASYCLQTGVPIFARLTDAVANAYWS